VRHCIVGDAQASNVDCATALATTKRPAAGYIDRPFLRQCRPRRI